MGVFIRAVVTGFGFSLGSALFKKVSERLGLKEEAKGDLPPDDAQGAAEDGEEDEGGGEGGGEDDGGGAQNGRGGAPGRDDDPELHS